jgi:hypothetical protein
MEAEHGLATDASQRGKRDDYWMTRVEGVSETPGRVWAWVAVVAAAVVLARSLGTPDWSSVLATRRTQPAPRSETRDRPRSGHMATRTGISGQPADVL